MNGRKVIFLFILVLKTKVTLDQKQREELKSLLPTFFTFWAYVKSFFSLYSGDDVKKFTALYKALAYFMAVENTIKSYETLNDVSHLPTSHLATGKLTTFDVVYAEERGHFVGGRKYLVTKSGVILSYLYFLSFIPICVIFGADLVLRTNPEVNISSSFPADMVNVPLDSDLNADLPLMIEVTKSYGDFVAPVEWSINDNAYKNLDYHLCSESDYYSFNKTEPMNSNMKYFCLNLKSIIKSYYRKGYAEHFFTLLNCTAFPNNQLSDSRCSNIPPVQDMPLLAIVNYKFFRYDDSDPADLVKVVNENNVYQSTFNSKNRYYVNLWYTPFYLISDDNILFEDKTTQNYFGMTCGFQYAFKETGNYEPPKGNHFVYRLRMVNELQSIERKFKKLPNTLSIIFTLQDIIFAFLYFINKLISGYYFHLYFLNIIFKKLNEKMINEELDKEYQQKKLGEDIELVKVNNFVSMIHDNSQYKLNIQNQSNVLDNSQGSVLEYMKPAYNFNSYIKLKLCSCLFRKNRNIIKYNFLRTKAIQMLSVENIIKSHGKVKKLKENLMNEKPDEFTEKPENLNNTSVHIQSTQLLPIPRSNFLKSFDILSDKIFYINSKRKFATKLGGFFSMIHILIFLAVFSFFSVEFVSRVDPGVRTIFRDPEDPVGMWKMDIPVIWAYSKEIDNVVILEYSGVAQDVPVDYGITKCTLEELKSYGITYNDTLVYKCTNCQKIFYNFYLGNVANVDYKMKTCNQNPTKYNCTGEPDRKKLYHFEYYSLVKWLNYSDYNNFLVTETISDSWDNNYYVNKRVQFRYKVNKLTDDKGWFFSEKTDYIYTNKDNLFMRGYGDAFWLNVGMEQEDKNVVYVTRNYKKFPEVIANILSMTLLFNVILRIIHVLLIDYMFLKFVLKKSLAKINLVGLRETLNTELKKSGKIFIYIRLCAG
jgi:hypothetical protein